MSQAQILKADFGISNGLRFPLLLSQLVSFVGCAYSHANKPQLERNLGQAKGKSSSGTKGIL